MFVSHPTNESEGPQLKISLSASYYIVPAVARVLRTCDVVYTTNVDRRDEIREAVGPHTVKFIPTASSSMLDFLKQLTPGAEYIDFRDLRRVVQKSLLDRDKETAVALSGYFGWTVTPVVLVDEEGIEGHRWTYRGFEYECPENDVPDEVFEHMAKAMPA